MKKLFLAVLVVGALAACTKSNPAIEYLKARDAKKILSQTPPKPAYNALPDCKRMAETCPKELLNDSVRYMLGGGMFNFDEDRENNCLRTDIEYITLDGDTVTEYLYINEDGTVINTALDVTEYLHDIRKRNGL